MSKTPENRGQLELPVLTSVKGSQVSDGASHAVTASPPKTVGPAHMPQASAADAAIFRQIADSYFRSRRKS